MHSIPASVHTPFLCCILVFFGAAESSGGARDVIQLSANPVCDRVIPRCTTSILAFTAVGCPDGVSQQHFNLTGQRSLRKWSTPLQTVMFDDDVLWVES